MKCPTCGDHTPDAWQLVQFQAAGGGLIGELRAQEGDEITLRQVSLDFMHCANNDCKELVIRMHELYRDYEQADALRAYEWRTDTSVVRPRFAAAGRVDPLVPPTFKRDYQEAAAILGISPRMSTVLSRRILADLLEKYAALTDFSLKDRIDAFVADTSHPHQLRENLGYLVEMGNFGAHTQKNDQAEVVDVDPDEAEWTLDLVARLFDYFIVSPERDRKMREAFGEKLKDAKRRPINPPPDASS